MVEFLLNVHWIIVTLVFSVFLTGLAVLMRHLVRSVVTKEHLRRTHDVAAVVYANVGVLYSIVLGLMAVHGQERWIDLKHVSEVEASQIIGVGRAAKALGDSAGTAIIEQSIDYAQAVTQTEWTDDLEGPSPEGRQAISSLWSSVMRMERTDDKNALASQVILDITNDVVTSRMERIGLMREHVGALLWTILIGGGVSMTFFLVLFAPERDMLHTVMMFCVTLVVSIVIMLIFSYEHPTDGAMALSPEPYESAAQTLMDLLKSER